MYTYKMEVTHTSENQLVRRMNREYTVVDNTLEQLKHYLDKALFDMLNEANMSRSSIVQVEQNRHKFTYTMFNEDVISIFVKVEVAPTPHIDVPSVYDDELVRVEVMVKAYVNVPRTALMSSPVLAIRKCFNFNEVEHTDTIEIRKDMLPEDMQGEWGFSDAVLRFDKRWGFN